MPDIWLQRILECGEEVRRDEVGRLISALLCVND